MIQNSYLSEPRYEKTGIRGFPTMSDTNRALQPRKMTRELNFRIQKLEGILSM